MYTQPQFEETRIEVLHRLVRAHPLATLVRRHGSGVAVDHMPFLLGPDIGERGVLRGHVPRANPLSRAFAERAEAVAVFQGPESYVTPSWYPSKHAHGKAVPTWNYAVVHVRGCPRMIDDADWLLAHLSELTEEHESEQALPWKLTDAPEDYRASMIGRLVGIEMPIESIVGKWKVSQNRPVGDRLGVAAGLKSRGDDRSLAMADLVLERVDPSDR
jgi:transcriptional regulator